MGSDAVLCCQIGLEVQHPLWCISTAVQYWTALHKAVVVFCLWYPLQLYKMCSDVQG